MYIHNIEYEYQDLAGEFPYKVTIEAGVLRGELDILENTFFNSIVHIRKPSEIENFSDEEILEALRLKYPHKFI